jgi:hypothetical protein
MATTYNFTDGSITGQPKPVETLPNTSGLFVRSNTVNFAKQNLDVSETDVAQVIKIPADTWVLSVCVRVITAETASSEFDVGTGLDVDQWLDAGDMANTGNLETTWAPEYFAAADTVDITSSGSVDYDAGVIEVVALMCPGNSSDAAGASTVST